MASPLGLTIKNSLADMQIGDCIPCKYVAGTSGAIGTFSELGTCVATEIPVASSATPNGLFYFVKVDKGMLIADRNIQHTITWNTLNASGYIEGKLVNLGQDNLIRSLTGGTVFADYFGNKSSTDFGFGGYPVNNEWDIYIANSDLNGKITKGDDNVWHWSGASSHGQNTGNANTYRVSMGKNGVLSHTIGVSSTTATASYGFRPVLIYIENDSKNTTFWY